MSSTSESPDRTPQDAAVANIGNDQRKGAFIEGGTFHHQVIGYQENHGGSPPASASTQPAPAAATQQAEVLLVTVTKGETQAILDALQAQSGRRETPRYLSGRTYYDLGQIGGARVWLVRSQMGGITPGGAFETVYSAIGTVRPNAIIMVGVAFGIGQSDKQIGDILVAKQLMSYEPQRVGTLPDGEAVVIPRGDRVMTSTRLIGYCEDGDMSWSSSQAQVHFGLVLSGEKLLDHMPAVEELQAHEPGAIGGEMEGAGLYAAARYHKVDWVLIKAICDWADGHKGVDKEARQVLAAKNAAAFTLHVLARGGFAPEAWQG
ncbi:MAG: hypothetical protein OHK0022_08730 [Roseiflexaceae bacterium]